MTDHTFHFTLGPVQGFVAQARRTRDFWAGSFLLSWLAGAAMQAVTQQGGKIDFPAPDDDYLAWLTGMGSGDAPPRQGCIPNRFKAIQCQVPGNFQPEHIEQTVRDAWRALAEAAWQRDLQPRQPSADTRTIWERQINGFWDISWVLGQDNNLLDRRKNWRAHFPPEEGGVKCSMMAGWQELSGAAHPGDSRLDEFWNPLRKDHLRDFDDDEKLCAIAFVKRRFVKVFADLNAPMPGDWTLHGWQLDSQMPSTLDLAAARWVARLPATDALQAASAALVAASPQLGRSDRGLGLLHCVRQHPNRTLAQLHSSTLFAHVLDNSKLCPDRAAVQAMRQAIKAANQGQPSPFYAILLMDGDSLGQLLQSDTQAPPKISQALNRFTKTVPDLVDQHSGFLIYAGGDDVLALLPLDDALGCAAAIRAEYLAAFREAFGRDKTSTISAAVTFAHVKIPLTLVLRDSHHLLDAIAKEQTGRDALAVRVLKPSGEALQWARPWEKAWSEEQPNELAITRIAKAFAGQDDKTFSSKFFYRIRERFVFINPPKDQPDTQSVFNHQEALALLAVDYLASGVNDGRRDKLTLQDAERLIEPLLAQCRPVTRHLDGDLELFCERQRLDPDGALLVRFLAQKGAETR